MCRTATAGQTEFSNMHAAYDDLSDDIKRRLDGATATHDFNKFWEMMRQQGDGTRPRLTQAQRMEKPPVSQPLVLEHPITGRSVLYANPGYATGIDGVSEAESEELLQFLFDHQLSTKFRYTHHWAERDLLMWDDIGTIHNAVADYGPGEPRLIKPCLSGLSPTPTRARMGANLI